MLGPFSSPGSSWLIRMGEVQVTGRSLGLGLELRPSDRDVLATLRVLTEHPAQRLKLGVLLKLRNPQNQQELTQECSFSLDLSPSKAQSSHLWSGANAVLGLGLGELVPSWVMLSNELVTRNGDR